MVVPDLIGNPQARGGGWGEVIAAATPAHPRRRRAQAVGVPVPHRNWEINGRPRRRMMWGPAIGSRKGERRSVGDHHPHPRPSSSFLLLSREQSHEAQQHSTNHGSSNSEGLQRRAMRRGGSKGSDMQMRGLLERTSSPREKAMELWSNVRNQLVEFSALPEYLRDNNYILRYYRVDYPFKRALLSVFHMHNETFNIWTHLVGFLLFLGLTVYTATHMPAIVEQDTLQRWQSGIMESWPSYLQLPEALSSCVPGTYDGTQCIQRPITRWPFFVFLGGAMFCLLASATCHLFGCLSKRYFYALMRMDYAGISTLIAASFYPPVYYIFMCNPFLCKMYLGIITTMGIGTIGASLLPVFQSAEYRPFRAALFFTMGVSGIIPCVHKIWLYENEPVAYKTLYMEIAMGLLYGVGALIYATRIPERWKPGTFDIIGNSHQLFHVLVVAGAYTHYHNGLLYLKWRDVTGCPVVA